jgi:hypothetical protein
MIKLLFATTNAGKLTEAHELGGSFGITVVRPLELGLGSPSRGRGDWKHI